MRQQYYNMKNMTTLDFLLKEVDIIVGDTVPHALKPVPQTFINIGKDLYDTLNSIRQDNRTLNELQQRIGCNSETVKLNDEFIPQHLNNATELLLKLNYEHNKHYWLVSGYVRIIEQQIQLYMNIDRGINHIICCYVPIIEKSY
eukprot:545043_1